MGDGNDPRGITKHIVEGGVPTSEYEIAAAAVSKGGQSAGGAQNEIERPSLAIVERLQEATLVRHLRLNELPVVQRVAMTKGAYRPCKPLLSQETEQSTDHCKGWTRTLPHKEQRCNAWVSFVLAKCLYETAAAVSAQNAKEEVYRLLHIGWRPCCHLCAAASQ